LRKAAELASRGAADVLLLHDVDPVGAGGSPRARLDAAAALTRVEAQRQRLLRAARRWLPSGKVIVTSENDPARAIVEHAASTGVDTIIVGTRPRPWRARSAAQTVAARVVERSDRSVLVVPIDGVEPAHSTGAGMSHAL
jgi:nucleotide-binding universal stress UspA family protein